MKSKTNKKSAGLTHWLHRKFKLVFVPHAANQYRPHLIRRTGLLAVGLGVVAIQLYGAVAPVTVFGARQEISVAELLSATNSERHANSRPQLVLDDKLMAAAALKAQDMFKRQYWAHTSPEGVTPWYWFGRVGYDYAYAGENLAKNFTSSEAVTTAWMASPEHRANVLDAQYTQVGFAVVNGVLDSKPTTLVVALYGKPVSSASPAIAAPSTSQVNAAPQQPIGLDTRIVMAAKSVTLPALLALTLLTVSSAVATTAHFYRKKLPENLRSSWYRHHGLYKTVGLVSVAIMIISLYSSGQI